jgi:L-lysine exporter family protein LysE/ArgO
MRRSVYGGLVPPPAALAAALAGLLFGLSLIVAVGPQNLFVLRQGALRRHVGTVVVICSVSDVVLIVAGVAGVGLALGPRSWLLTGLRLAGACFLLGYGALAFRRAQTSGRTVDPGAPGTLDPVAPDTPAPAAAPAAAPARTAASWRTVAAACLAFTWLNPAVYLDTVVLLGTVANSHPGRQWWFALGAAIGSLAWFAALGYGAALLAPVLARPRAARLLDLFVGAVMVVTAIRVLVGA